MHYPNGNYLNGLLAQAQDGQVADNLARIYGISPTQAQQAIDAVLPAFQLGLERSAQSQAGMMGLLGTMARNPYAQAYENSGFGFSPQIREQGNDALAAMFGSPDVSRAVAAQAAATTGLSSALIKQMLPAIAAMVLGGLMKGGSSGGASNPLQDLLGGLLGGAAPRGGSAGAGSGNPLQDLLGGILGGAMGGGGLGGAPDRPSPRSGGADAGGGARNPLEDLLGGMFGGGAGAPSQRSPDDGAGRGSNPLEDLLGGMLGGGASPRSGGEGPGRGSNPLEDLLGGMFGGSGSGVGGGREEPPEATGGGARSQDPKLQPFQDIFDQFFDPKTGGRR